MTVEVAADKIVDLFLGLLMQVLELVHGGELGDVETVGEDAVGFALQEVLALVGGDVGDGGEDIAGMRRCSLDTIPVVDAAVPRLGVDVEVLQVIVEIDGAGAEVSSEEGSVRGEDGRDINAALLAQRQGHAGKPLVEVGDDGLVLLVGDILEIFSIGHPAHH